SLSIGAPDVSDTQMLFQWPVGLLSGVQGVQVIQRRLMGSPPTPHRGVESNLDSFVLRPQIQLPVGLTNVQTPTDGTRSAVFDVQLDPAVAATQRVVLLLNEFQPPASPPAGTAARAYSFVAPPRISLQSPPPNPPPHQTLISIPINGVQPGAYLVRVQVDGAESPLGANS